MAWYRDRLAVSIRKGEGWLLRLDSQIELISTWEPLGRPLESLVDTWPATNSWWTS